jgi:hypothetical protein
MEKGGRPSSKEVDFFIKLLGKENFMWEGGKLEIEIVLYSAGFETGGFGETCPNIREVFLKCVCEVREGRCA